VTPTRYAFRSFNRQWIIPDNRVINQPNPTLWAIHSTKQIYITALKRAAPSTGPALTLTSAIPDYDHYRGSFGGRVFPLLIDPQGKQSNVQPGVLETLNATYETPVTGEDVVAYIAAVVAHPAYAVRFAENLVQPGLRIPLTPDVAVFKDAVSLGREVIWLQTFGERFVDAKQGRPAGAPRMPAGTGPTIPVDGAISADEEKMPDTMAYDPALHRLHIGSGYIDKVAPEVWAYEVSGMQVVTHWFSYRKKDRTRATIGDRRPSSSLGDIQPDGWLTEYTSELVNVLHVLGRLVQLEPKQKALLNIACEGASLNPISLPAPIASSAAPPQGVAVKSDKQMSLLD
jgi:Type ISP C-terminal specificity domain